ncbi:hypothetical protein [Blastochloris tepida]|uniref:Uncharacterized protein n=1 Tax=Blastochloris tepida TaxID=2233851 RepID=A0A348G1G1_9HYPH|nr:hypothetical protein [Blastochloris tepida]BBF93394.1 hypothetical protein BLTE_20790 [Blastochloris tepida]
MDLQRLARKLIDLGAPTIGRLLADNAAAIAGDVAGMIPLPIPFKETAIRYALQRAGAALGADIASPAELEAALDATPPAEAAAKLAPIEAGLAAMVEVERERIRAEAEVARVQVAEVNASIRAEAATRDGWWGTWRTILAYELALECPAWAALMMWAIVAGRIADLVAAASLLSVWWGARFGILGVHVWTGSHERQTAITGQPIPGVVGALAGAIKARR